MKFNFDTSEHSPLYEGSMSLDDVKAGAEYIPYNINHGFTVSGASNGHTFLSEPRFYKTLGDRTVMVAKSTEGADLHYGDGNAFLGDRGITPHLPSGQWNQSNFCVEINENSIKKFYDWLVNVKHDIKTAAKLKAAWPQWLVVKTLLSYTEYVGSTNRVLVQVYMVDDKVEVEVTEI